MRLILALFLVSTLAALGDFDQIPPLPPAPPQAAGIGAVLTNQQGQAVIQSLFPDSPAGKAGLAAGDVIVEVNGNKTAGLTLADVVNMVRGPQGTKVHLVVQRAGKAAPLKFDVVRKPLHVSVEQD